MCIPMNVGIEYLYVWLTIYFRGKFNLLMLYKGVSMNLEGYCVVDKCSIIDAMKKINENTKGIVYVCKDGVLCGSVTDGDVRRHILSGGGLSDSVTTIMNTSPSFCYATDVNTVHNRMLQQHIRSMPILDIQNHIVDIVFINEETEIKRPQLNIPVVIMAGGKGTRLYPYTQILPKPLIPIGEKTITEHIMSRFEEYGCRHFDMIVNYKKHFIKSYFLDNESTADVEFIEESEFLGTGGGLKLLEGKYQDTFFMTNCDILIEEDYAKILEYHKKNHNIITMVCAEKNMVIPYGTVEVSEEGQALALKEKPNFSFVTNTGFYVIEPEFLGMIPENTFIHITDVIQKCIDSQKNVGVYKISEEKWLDMGQMEEMERMRQKLNIK